MRRYMFHSRKRDSSVNEEIWVPQQEEKKFSKREDIDSTTGREIVQSMWRNMFHIRKRKH
jgi:hypothetical protein